VYADFLGGLGHDVRVVSGSSAALDQWQSWPPDVVILDMAISAGERALPDGGAPLHLKAVFSRAETDGHIFTFVNLSDAELTRLADYARRATASSVFVRPVPAGAR
jgi:hypothetical protein